MICDTATQYVVQVVWSDRTLRTPEVSLTAVSLLDGDTRAVITQAVSCDDPIALLREPAYSVVEQMFASLAQQLPLPF